MGDYYDPQVEEQGKPQPDCADCDKVGLVSHKLRVYEESFALERDRRQALETELAETREELDEAEKGLLVWKKDACEQRSLAASLDIHLGVARRSIKEQDEQIAELKAKLDYHAEKRFKAEILVEDLAEALQKLADLTPKLSLLHDVASMKDWVEAVAIDALKLVEATTGRTYDFSKVERGKYAEEYKQGTRTVVHDGGSEKHS